MNRLAAIWTWLVPRPVAVWDLYRIDRKHRDVHGHTRRQSLRVALWWERYARQSWVAARLEGEA